MQFWQFLDTQVSLEPTPVRWLVGQSVSQSVGHTFGFPLFSNGRSNQKNSKNKVHLFRTFALGVCFLESAFITKS